MKSEDQRDKKKISGMKGASETCGISSSILKHRWFTEGKNKLNRTEKIVKEKMYEKFLNFK